MKRIFVLAVLVVAVMAFAVSAYASTNSTYATWDATAPNDNPATPHKGYALNTSKCAVCHAVHKGENADAGGELLLRSSVADACTYCHITTNIGGDRIYNGVEAAYFPGSDAVGEFGGGFSHNPYGATCVSCHAVHGANTIDGANPTKILKDWPTDGSFHAYSTFALAKWSDPANEAVNDAQITAWCTGCHKYYTEYYADGDASTGYVQRTEYIGGPTTYEWRMNQSHVMTTTKASYANPQSTVTSPTQVAWGTSEYCRSCHDAPNSAAVGGIIQNSFPHYTPGYYRFMTVAPEFGAASSTNNTGTVDGLCVKCHINSGATAGVGIDF